jgi:4a-hydroxytetrahydrobiopterin dehydratase
MDWEEKNNYLERTFTFSSFASAFVFMTEVAALARQMEHYPWWENRLHVVVIRLASQGAQGCITERDRQMAQRIDELYHEMHV